MKKILLLSVISLVLAGSFLGSFTSCGGNRSQAPDTLKINTTDISADVVGFNGPTPVEISVCKGVITGIKALPNQETPKFLQKVLDSGLLESLNGKTLEEARSVELDAVTGATFTSKAMIENIRLGLEEASR